VLLVTAACAVGAARSSGRTDPRAALNELLAADRGFAAAGARADAVSAITAMLADDVWMPTRGQFARDKRAVAETLRNAFASAETQAEWAPIRGGISADGQHGFTLGYMTARKPDGPPIPLKYLSYWVKQPAGWRVVAYNVRRRPAGDVSPSMMEPALPARLIAPTSDPATIARHTESLIAAERAFSDRAQQIGLGPAFEENGSADAANMGGGDTPSFIVGPRAIARAVSQGATGPPSPVSWSADRAVVASSGDLGVTFGMIRPNAPPSDAARQTGAAFFTIWRRARSSDAWRYVAE
jgi:ketosteroid isomerase-like protein